MRIITGSAKGTRLVAPHGVNIRPTADRVKESMFNILGSIVCESRVLDLFAGTGNLGLEALSRGAVHTTFVDKDIRSIRLIHKNAMLTKLESRVTIMRSDVSLAFSRIKGCFDLVFCDPPYNHNFVKPLLIQLDSASILLDKAIIVMEASRHEVVDVPLKNLVLIRKEQFGETGIMFWQYRVGGNSCA